MPKAKEAWLRLVSYKTLAKARHWRGDVQAVVREIVDAIHEAEAETIGVSSGAGGSDPPPQNRRNFSYATPARAETAQQPALHNHPIRRHDAANAAQNGHAGARYG